MSDTSQDDATTARPNKGAFKRALVEWTRRALGISPDHPGDPVRSGATLLGAFSGAVISYGNLRDMAQDMGWGDAASSLFPICFDFTVIACTRAWMDTRLTDGEGGTRRYAGVWAVFFLALSVFGNIVEDMHKAGLINGTAWLVAAITASGVPALAIGICLHLMSKASHDLRARRERELAEAAARKEREDAERQRKADEEQRERARLAAEAEAEEERQRKRQEERERRDTRRQQAVSTDETPQRSGVSQLSDRLSKRARIESVWWGYVAQGERLKKDGGNLTFQVIDDDAGTKEYAKRVVGDLGYDLPAGYERPREAVNA